MVPYSDLSNSFSYSATFDELVIEAHHTTTMGRYLTEVKAVSGCRRLDYGVALIMPPRCFGKSDSLPQTLMAPFYLTIDVQIIFWNLILYSHHS